MADYTALEHIDIHSIAERYGLGDCTLTKLAGGAANSSFRVEGPSGAFTLTVLDNHDHASAARLARLTRALYAAGVPTTDVIPAVGGDLVTSWGRRPAIIKQWIEGTAYDTLPDRFLAAAGRILAQLHSADPGFPDLPVRTRRLSPEHEATIVEFKDQEFGEWLMRRLDRVRQLRSGHRDVLTHGDLYPDNLIVRPDGGLAVIDWETASLDDPLLDLGMALVGLADTGGQLDGERVRSVLDGYSSVRPLDSEDVVLLPAMAEHAALIIAFHRYYRHNVRFPNPRQALRYREMVGLVEKMPVDCFTG
ncbi:phosphotransferase [Nocardia vaccinii]|uniref:phosphotransferase n=1 Tax=Nocardia vaccinii TaxID=1822 RepID=UPI00082D0292|nr:phosphotransferase [Nocardia vaccinii]